MIYYYLYKTKNIINNKEYIGVHKTDNLRDGYIGCGVKSQNIALTKTKTINSAFISAVVNYGYDYFIKEVLQFFNTYEEALEAEKNIVTLEYIKKKDNYNTAIGGLGGFNTASIKPFELVDFEDNTYKGKNIKEFCQQRGLNYTSISKLVAGKQHTSQGFHLKNNTVKNILIFDLIENIIYQTYNLNTWCKEHITKSIIKNSKGTNNMLFRVLTKHQNLYDNRWWCCYEKDYKGYIEIDESKIKNGFIYTISYKEELFSFASVANFVKNSELTRHGFNLLEKGIFDNFKGYKLISKEWLFKDIKQKEIKGLSLSKKHKITQLQKYFK